MFSTPPHFNYNDAPSFCEMLIPELQKVYMQVHENLVKVAEAQEAHRLKRATIKDIKVGDEVWLYTFAVKKNQCKKLAKFNTGPFSVLEKIGKTNFKIAPLQNLSKTEVVHVDRLTRVKSRMHFPSPPEPQQTEPCVESMQNIPTTSESNTESSRILRPKRRNCVIPCYIQNQPLNAANFEQTPIPSSTEIANSQAREK